jgi:two-component system response regulator HydG
MNERPVVVLADDDPGVRFTLAEVLDELDVEVLEAGDGEAAWALIESRPVDLVLTDLKMPRLDGMGLLERVRGARPGLKVVMITAHGSERAAAQALRLGAYDYFAKPFELDEVAAAVRRATDAVRLAAENQRLRADLALARHMVFRSPAMSRVARVVERIGPRDVTVRIVGESGTGKELVARAIVDASARRDAAFVKFNCAALSRELAEAELFGHASGAFTGARGPRAGLFREADGGTLFLDEVAELDPSVQGKLLRVLQEGEVRALGEDRARRVDVRLLVATHRDLAEEVRAGRFREDLFYRLDVVALELPPLRDRPEDIEPLIDHFLRKYGERFGLGDVELEPEARAAILARSFPGNVRELENTIERLVALSPGPRVGLELGLDPAPAPLGLRERVDAFERGLILDALRRAGGNRSEAARRLGLARVTLLDKLKRHGLDETSE